MVFGKKFVLIVDRCVMSLQVKQFSFQIEVKTFRTKSRRTVELFLSTIIETRLTLKRLSNRSRELRKQESDNVSQPMEGNDTLFS